MAMAEGSLFTLDNGLRVILQPRPGTATVAWRLLVAGGSADDGERPGRAHFLEHALFRGSRRRSGEELQRAAEAMGGELSGGTTREYTSLDLVLPAGGSEGAAALLAELAFEPRFSPAELEREKPVVLAELGAASAGPERVLDLLLEALWGAHPLARPVRGDPAVVASLTAGELAAQHARCFTPERMVLSVAGDFALPGAREEIQAAFAPWPGGGGPPETPPAPRPRRGSLFGVQAGPLAHLALGVSAPSLGHRQRAAVQLAAHALGRGASSHLYRAVRQEAGLAYRVSAAYMPLAGTGYLAAWATCPQEAAQAAMWRMRQAWEQAAGQPPRGSALAFWRAVGVGLLRRGFETNRAAAGIAGIELLLTGRTEGLAAAQRRIGSVTEEEMESAARRWLDRVPCQVVVGPAPLDAARTDAVRHRGGG